MIGERSVEDQNFHLLNWHTTGQQKAGRNLKWSQLVATIMKLNQHFYKKYLAIGSLKVLKVTHVSRWQTLPTSLPWPGKGRASLGDDGKLTYLLTHLW